LYSGNGINQYEIKKDQYHTIDPKLVLAIGTNRNSDNSKLPTDYLFYVWDAQEL
jgi:hypothetical protein